jgi:hypothetical protein
MKNKMIDIVIQVEKGEKDAIDAHQELLDLFGVMASACFDEGFNMSNERYNAEFRDDYSLFDEDDIKRYEQNRTIVIQQHLP